MMTDLNDLLKFSSRWPCEMNRGASIREIECLSAFYGHHFPIELKRLYGVANGELLTDGLFCGYIFMPISKVIADLEAWESVRQDELRFGERYRHTIPSFPEGAVKDLVHNEYWIPFASAYGGASLAIDLDPGPAGNLGQVINCGADDFNHFRIAGSFDEFLKVLVEKYQQQRWHPRYEGASWSLYEELRALT